MRTEPRRPDAVRPLRHPLDRKPATCRALASQSGYWWEALIRAESKHGYRKRVEGPGARGDRQGRHDGRGRPPGDRAHAARRAGTNLAAPAAREDCWRRAEDDH